jgi:hypothetical protein
MAHIDDLPKKDPKAKAAKDEPKKEGEELSDEALEEVSGGTGVATPNPLTGPGKLPGLGDKVGLKLPKGKTGGTFGSRG